MNVNPTNSNNMFWGTITGLIYNEVKVNIKVTIKVYISV